MDHEKDLGVPTGLAYGLAGYIILILIIVLFYFLFGPLIKGFLYGAIP